MLTFVFFAAAAGLKVLLPQTFALPRTAPIDPRNELTTAHFRIGPFHVKAHSAMEGKNVFLDRPAFNERIEVSSFGSFVPTYANGTEIPRAWFYLHHILAYDQQNGDFVAGCSDERTNWGPDELPYPYRQILEPKAQVKAAGFHMNSLVNQDFTFYINYTVAYKVHVPTDPPVRVARSFYFMDNYNVPGGAKRNSTHSRVKHFAVPRDMVIVSMNGHLHQGGKRLTIEFEDKKHSPNTLCTSYNMYADDYKCFWDCPTACPYENDWTSQWATTTCYMEMPVRRGDKLISTAEYDNSCAWRGVMAWWFNFGWDGKTIGGMMSK